MRHYYTTESLVFELPISTSTRPTEIEQAVLVVNRLPVDVAGRIPWKESIPDTCSGLEICSVRARIDGCGITAIVILPIAQVYCIVEPGVSLVKYNNLSAAIIGRRVIE